MFYFLFLLSCVVVISKEIFTKEKIHNFRRLRHLLGAAGIPLFVRDSMTGDIIATLDMYHSAMVFDIYAAINPSMDPCQWNLMYDGEIIKNEGSLADYGIGPYSTVEIQPSSYTEKFLRAFANTNFKEILETEEKNLNDYRDWCPIVRINEQQEPISLIMEDMELQGNNIDFGCLPRTLEEITITKNKINGEVDFSKLPNNLRDLDLHNNTFTGNVNLMQLPATLQRLIIAFNKFDGTLDFSQLPPSLTKLFLNKNSFTGNMDFSAPLPPLLSSIHLGFNPFGGIVNLSGLKKEPEQLKTQLFINFRRMSADFRDRFSKEAQKVGVEMQVVIL